MADFDTPKARDNQCGNCGLDAGEHVVLARAWKVGACKQHGCSYKVLGYLDSVLLVDLVVEVKEPGNGLLCAECAAELLHADEEDMVPLEEDRHGS